MTQARYDAIVVGGGHNGLVAAGYLAKAGRKVLVLERRPIVGETRRWSFWKISRGRSHDRVDHTYLASGGFGGGNGRDGSGRAAYDLTRTAGGLLRRLRRADARDPLQGRLQAMRIHARLFGPLNSTRDDTFVS